MATTEQLKSRAKISEQIDKYGPDYLRSILSDNPLSDITPPEAPEIESGYAPLTPDQLAAIELTKQPSDLNIPPEFRSPESDLSKYIARPPESITDQVINPQTSQFELSKSIPAAPIPEMAPAQVVKPDMPLVKSSAPQSSIPSSPSAQQFDVQASSYQDPTMDDFNKQLEDARSQDSQRNLMFGLLKASQMGGAALAGSKADTSYADTQLEKGNKAVNELKTNEELKQEKKKFLQTDKLRDKKSPASVQAREVARSVGLKISDDTSAQDLLDNGFSLSTLFGQKQALEAKKEENQLRREELTDRKSSENDLKAKNKLSNDTLNWSKEASNQPAYKRFQENQEAYVFADKIAKGEVDSSGVDDGALILQAVKLAQADSSVVRESDQRLFNNAGGLTQSAQELQQKLLGGGKLTPPLRKQYVAMMLRARDNLASSAKEQTSHLYSKFLKTGVSEDEIPGTLRAINSFGDQKDAKSTNKPSMKLGAPMKPGTPIKQKSTGKTFKVNADGVTATEI